MDLGCAWNPVNRSELSDGQSVLLAEHLLDIFVHIDRPRDTASLKIIEIISFFPFPTTRNDFPPVEWLLCPVRELLVTNKTFMSLLHPQVVIHRCYSLVELLVASVLWKLAWNLLVL